jgi:hypothetical protein
MTVAVKPEPVPAPAVVPDPAPDAVPAPPAPPVPDRVTAHRARSAREQGPNLGRLVLYHQVESPQNPAIVTPAIIQAVRDTTPETVRLFVFGHGGAELVDDVLEGEAVGQWSWAGAANGPGAAAPTLTALEPATVVIGAPSLTLHVKGTGFTASSVISFAGHDEPTTLVSATEVTTGIDMGVWLGPDAVPVTVRNGDGAPSAPLTFTFTAATAAREGEAAPSRRK